MERTLGAAFFKYPYDEQITEYLKRFQYVFKKKGDDAKKFFDDEGPSNKAGVYGEDCLHSIADTERIAQTHEDSEHDLRAPTKRMKVNVELNVGSCNNDESNTQWVVKNIDQVVDSLQTTLIGFSDDLQHFDSDFQLNENSFLEKVSLDISQGLKDNTNNTEPLNTKPIDFVTTTTVEEGSPKTAQPQTKTEKRQLKPSIYVCSPYVNKKTVVENKISSIENSVATFLFSMRGEKRYVLCAFSIFLFCINSAH